MRSGEMFKTGGIGWGGKPARRRAGLRFRRAEARRAAPQPEREYAPVWLAALAAISHRATRDGQNREVGWKCASGRALYTNAGADAELIQPLGVNLAGGANAGSILDARRDQLHDGSLRGSLTKRLSRKERARRAEARREGARHREQHPCGILVLE